MAMIYGFFSRTDAYKFDARISTRGYDLVNELK